MLIPLPAFGDVCPPEIINQSKQKGQTLPKPTWTLSCFLKINPGPPWDARSSVVWGCRPLFPLRPSRREDGGSRATALLGVPRAQESPGMGPLGSCPSRGEGASPGRRCSRSGGGHCQVDMGALGRDRFKVTQLTAELGVTSA